MDPETCLITAEGAIIDQEADLAAEALHEYDDWRANGGFEPEITLPRINKRHPATLIDGDEFRNMLQASYIDTFGHVPTHGG